MRTTKDSYTEVVFPETEKSETEIENRPVARETHPLPAQDSHLGSVPGTADIKLGVEDPRK
eukprot:5256480-Amphidinium_carterae.2